MKDKEITGIVVAEKCMHCGHHEIGIKTESGEYVRLELGSKVTVHVTEE